MPQPAAHARHRAKIGIAGLGRNVRIEPELLEILDGAFCETWVEAQLGEALPAEFGADLCESPGDLQPHERIRMPVGAGDQSLAGAGADEWNARRGRNGVA